MLAVSTGAYVGVIGRAPGWSRWAMLSLNSCWTMMGLVIETALGRGIKPWRLRASAQNLGLRLDIVLLRLIHSSSLSWRFKLWLCNHLLFWLVLKRWWLTTYNLSRSWWLRSGNFHARTLRKMRRLNLSRQKMNLKAICQIVKNLNFFSCTLVFRRLAIRVQLRTCISGIHSRIFLRESRRCVLLAIANNLLYDLLWRNINHWILGYHLALSWGYLLLCVLLRILFVEIQ